MDMVRVGEIMASGPEHERLPHDPDYAFGSAYIADHFCPILVAAIPIFDCGFMHADAVYDVVSVSRGLFFRLEQHQARFARACEAIRARNPFDREKEASILHELVARAGLRDAYVWWSVTRGIPPMGRNEMVDAAAFTNRFYAFATPFVFLFDDEQRARGVDLIVSRDRIRIPARAVDPKAKNFCWLDMQMALFEAGDRGAEWAVLTDEEGFLAEAAGANVFGVVDDVVVTPGAGCLEGITRQSVFDLCDELGLAWKARRVHADELRGAQEVFMTTTAGSVMPVRSVDGVPLGGRNGPGELSVRLHNLYWEKRWAGW
ncbi:MAG TPA: branched-chain amino acid--2-keto-4-methylthiobutyrate aminotransferase, partial [Candidatus Hydrogenedentes bacterium]|nr:branched-chain amino acid--2-keto-4-methylthiobutyrate aminotransferase [Candidatus Hydrogenedentota bacterium]